jgi:carbon storage regulator
LGIPLTCGQSLAAHSGWPSQLVARSGNLEHFPEKNAFSVNISPLLRIYNVQSRRSKDRNLELKEEHMLVLSRKLGESIYIDDVKVTVVRVDRNRVKIGIEAPSHVQVLREEIRDRQQYVATCESADI